MWKRLLQTNGDPTAVVLRLTLGAVMLPHGAQKLLGWFGGAGFSGTVDYFSAVLGIPAPLAILVILFESVGAVALLAGFLSRVMALGIAAIMAVAVLKVHLAVGFFMNWLGNQPGEGFEFHLLALAIAFYVIVKGSGPASVDRRLVALTSA